MTFHQGDSIGIAYDTEQMGLDWRLYDFAITIYTSEPELGVCYTTIHPTERLIDFTSRRIAFNMFRADTASLSPGQIKTRIEVIPKDGSSSFFIYPDRTGHTLVESKLQIEYDRQ